jgi:hypothetical protein
MVNPSIFGLKSTIDGFLGAKTKGKPLGMRDLLKAWTDITDSIQFKNFPGT